MQNQKPPEKPRTGFPQGQAPAPGDFDTLIQHKIVAAFSGTTDPVPAANNDLAIKEDRCHVCDFPAIAGKVEGQIEAERYSLLICQSCLQHAVLCLRDSYRQCRLFDDDFELEELCNFGKRKKPSLSELLEQSDDSAPESERIKDWEQAEPIGREYGADDEGGGGQMKHPDLPRRVMRLKEVIMICGLSRSSIYSYIADGKFPQPRKIGSRAVGWDSWEIERWIDDRLGAREWKPSPEGV
jgi:prophage regulatory protein